MLNMANKVGWKIKVLWIKVKIAWDALTSQKKWPKTGDKRESNTCNIDLNVILIASEPHVCATNLT